MFASIRNRMILIAVLLVGSALYLVPRDVQIRQRTDAGMVDATVRRVPLKLGLDLQGGMHLALELDQTNQVSSDPSRDIDLALTVLRKRVDEFGVTEPLIQKSGDSRIVVELAGITDPARAKDIVQKSAFLEFRITDKTNALERVIPSMDRALRTLGVRGGVGTGQNAGGEPNRTSAVQRLLGDSANAVPDSAASDSTATDPSGGVLANLIIPAGAAGAGGAPGEYLVLESAFPRVDSILRIPEIRRLWPRNVEFFWSNQPVSLGVDQYRYLYALEDQPMVTGRNLTDAQAQIDPLTNGPVVLFELDRAGGRQFGAGTARHVGDFMAIILDGRVQGRPPVIQSRIDRRGQITLTGQPLTAAQDLALTLKAGALPIPLKIVEERQVGPSLGQDSIRQGITAGLVGTALVILIMIGYYRLAGVLAVSALGCYVLLTLGALSALDATLTLPGLAGLVLSVGIAVDANVLIFERIREELLRGKTVPLSVEEGFRHAMSAIIDSNVSTVLTALFLFQFGTGPVKGFAVTLVVGIAASLITAVFVTRTFFLIWLQRKPDLTTLSI